MAKDYNQLLDDVFSSKELFDSLIDGFLIEQEQIVNNVTILKNKTCFFIYIFLLTYINNINEILITIN